MKTKELLRILKDMGYALVRSGKHDVYAKPGHHVAIPHGNGKEVNRMVARRILKEVGFEDWRSV